MAMSTGQNAPSKNVLLSQKKKKKKRENSKMRHKHEYKNIEI